MVARGDAELDRGQVRSRSAASSPIHPPFDFDTPIPWVLNTRRLRASRHGRSTLPRRPRTGCLSGPPPTTSCSPADGTAPAREILDEQSAPGATLDCSQGSARALARNAGSRRYDTPRVLLAVAERRRRDAPGVPGADGHAAWPPAVAFSTLHPMPGRVELSVAYRTSLPVTLSAGGCPSTSRPRSSRTVRSGAWR